MTRFGRTPPERTREQTKNAVVVGGGKVVRAGAEHPAGVIP
jgi:hypothetical protein